MSGEAAAFASSRAFWLWGALAVLGLAGLAFSWRKARQDEPESLVVVGVPALIALAVATWLSRAAGAWWWSLIWGVAGLALLDAGRRTRRINASAGGVTLSVSLACLVFALASPLVSATRRAPAPGTAAPARASAPTRAPVAAAPAAPVAPREAQAPAVEPRERTRPASEAPRGSAAGSGKSISRTVGTVRAVLGGVMSSGWGLAYLALAFLLGQLALRRWGGTLALAGLLGAVGVAGAQGWPGLQTAAALGSAGPVAWASAALAVGARWLGSPGWGALLAGVAVVAVLFPATREAAAAGRRVRQASWLRGLLGTSLAARGVVGGKWGMARAGVASLLVLALGTAAPIALWIALRRLAGGAVALGFAPLGVPDITVPNFRPVAHASYFVLALLAGLAVVLRGEMLERARVVQGVGGAARALRSMLGALVLALFVPAGVVLFFLGYSLASALALGLLSLGERELPAGADVVARRPFVAPSPFPRQPAPAPSRAEPPPFLAPCVEAPAQMGDVLYRQQEGFVDLLALGSGECLALDRTARVTLVTPNHAPESTRLELERPLGLARGADGAFLVVGGVPGRLLRLTWERGAAPLVVQLPCAGPIGCFAANPFGTILAIAEPDGGETHACLLAAGKQQLLASGLAGVTALAFAFDGRTLAIGCRDGTVRLLDMVTRQEVRRLETDRLAAAVPHPAGLIAAAPDGAWVVVTGGRHLTSFGADGRRRAGHEIGDVSALAVCPASGRVAVGTAAGWVAMFSATLGEVRPLAPVHSGPVAALGFSESGSALLTAGAGDGELRRVCL